MLMGRAGARAADQRASATASTGTGTLSQAAVGRLRGIARGPWARVMLRDPAAPLVLAHASTPHVPGWRARPYAGGRTAHNQEQFQQNGIIRYGLLHSVTRCRWASKGLGH